MMMFTEIILTLTYNDTLDKFTYEKMVKVINNLATQSIYGNVFELGLYASLNVKY